MARSPVTVSLSDELLETIDAVCAKSGLNRSQQVEKLVTEALGAEGSTSFYKSIEIRARASECLQAMRGFADDEGPFKFEKDREWIVRIYVATQPGRKPFGGWTLTGDGATGVPTLDCRSALAGEPMPAPTPAMPMNPPERPKIKKRKERRR